MPGAARTDAGRAGGAGWGVLGAGLLDVLLQMTFGMLVQDSNS